MDLISLFLLGLGLAMDSVAVSVVGGIAAGKHGRKSLPTALKLAVTFGVFQALMLVVGYFAGEVADRYLAAVDHWIAFALLAFIGGRMVYESRKDEEAERLPFGIVALLLAGVATSIDALAVGLSLGLLQVDIFLSAIIVGGVTFALCVPAALLGGRLGGKFSKHAELIGGVILIGLAFRILYEHW
jgi:manganese efflux pump family protein